MGYEENDGKGKHAYLDGQFIYTSLIDLNDEQFIAEILTKDSLSDEEVLVLRNINKMRSANSIGDVVQYAKASQAQILKNNLLKNKNIKQFITINAEDIEVRDFSVTLTQKNGEKEYFENKKVFYQDKMYQVKNNKVWIGNEVFDVEISLEDKTENAVESNQKQPEENKQETETEAEDIDLKTEVISRKKDKEELVKEVHSIFNKINQNEVIKHSAEETNKVINNFMANNFPQYIYESVTTDTIDEQIKRQAEIQGADISNIEAWIEPESNKIYINSEVIAPHDVPRVIFHELVGHYGLPTIIGKKDFHNFLLKIWKENRNEIEKKKDIYSNISNLKLTEEWLADNAEKFIKNSKEMGFFQKAITSFKNLLRTLPFTKDVRYTNNDIANLMQKAFKYTKNQPGNKTEILSKENPSDEEIKILEKNLKYSTKQKQDNLISAEKFIVENLNKNTRNKTFKIILPIEVEQKVENIIGEKSLDHTITINSVIHSIKNHGENGIKNNKKSIPITNEIASLIPNIMVSPDKIILGSVDRNGNKSIRFTKEISNGQIIVVEKQKINNPQGMETITMWAELSNVTDAHLKKKSPSSHVQNVIISKSDIINIKKDAQNATKNSEDLQNNAKFFLKAHNGKPSNLTEKQHAQIRTPEFKAWFGDGENDAQNASKIVDENGEPLIVYHGTSNDFNTFDKNKIGSKTDNGLFGKGFYFSNKKVNYGNKHLETYLSIKNPFMWKEHDKNKKQIAEILEISEDWFSESGGGGFRLSNEGARFFDISYTLSKKGFDGVIIKHNEKFTEIVAFEPNQIKSATENNGDFSTEDNDIRFSIKKYDKNVLEKITPKLHVKTSNQTKEILLQIKGKELHNNHDNTNARITGNGIRKLTSNAAMDKSRNNGFTNEEHLTIAANLEQLFPDAFLSKVESDRIEDVNINTIKRYSSLVFINDKFVEALWTVKDTTQHGNNIYSVELMDLELKEKTARDDALKHNEEVIKDNLHPLTDGADNINSLYEQAIDALKNKYKFSLAPEEKHLNILEKITPKLHVKTSNQTKEILLQIKGKELHNNHDNTNAKINGKGINKILSSTAMEKSRNNGFTNEEHLTIAANLEQLFPDAFLSKIENDRIEDANLNAIKRYSSLVFINDKFVEALWTVKDTTQHGNNIYSVELMDLELKEKPPETTQIRASTQQSQMTARSLTDGTDNINNLYEQAIDALKNKYKFSLAPEEKHLNILEKITPKLHVKTSNQTKEILLQIKGKELHNNHDNTNAKITRPGIEKMVSNAAMYKSRNNGFTNEEHLTIAANLEQLFPDAFLSKVESDRIEDVNINTIKRYSSLVFINDKFVEALWTVKDTTQHGNNIYSVELMDLELKEKTARDDALKHNEKTEENQLNPLTDGADNINSLYEQAIDALKNKYKFSLAPEEKHLNILEKITPKLHVKTRGETESILKKIKGKELHNNNDNINAKITGKGIGKITSNAAMEKSNNNGFTNEEHLTIAANLEQLFPDAFLSKVESDRIEDVNINTIKRYSSLVFINDKFVEALWTVKDTTQHGNNIYSVELMDLELKEKPPETAHTKGAAKKLENQLNPLTDGADNINNLYEQAIDALKNKYKFSLAPESKYALLVEALYKLNQAQEIDLQNATVEEIQNHLAGKYALPREIYSAELVEKAMQKAKNYRLSQKEEIFGEILYASKSAEKSAQEYQRILNKIDKEKNAKEKYEEKTSLNLQDQAHITKIK